MSKLLICLGLAGLWLLMGGASRLTLTQKGVKKIVLPGWFSSLWEWHTHCHKDIALSELPKFLKAAAQTLGRPGENRDGDSVKSVAVKKRSGHYSPPRNR